MKTSELTGIALDWAVAKCEAYPMDIWYDEDALPMIRDDEPPEWKPSTDWAQGGPIIEQEKIAVNYDHTGRYIDCWTAAFPFSPSIGGPTPLIAAMRCYVASKLGDNVEIPEGLA